MKEPTTDHSKGAPTELEAVSESCVFGVDTSAEEYIPFQRILSSDESSSDGGRDDMECSSGVKKQRGIPPS